MQRRGFLGMLAALALPWKRKKAFNAKACTGCDAVLAPGLGIRGLVDDGPYLTANVWDVGPPLTEERLIAAMRIARASAVEARAHAIWEHQRALLDGIQWK